MEVSAGQPVEAPGQSVDPAPLSATLSCVDPSQAVDPAPLSATFYAIVYGIPKADLHLHPKKWADAEDPLPEELRTNLSNHFIDQHPQRKGVTPESECQPNFGFRDLLNEFAKYPPPFPFYDYYDFKKSDVFMHREINNKMTKQKILQLADIAVLLDGFRRVYRMETLWEEIKMDLNRPINPQGFASATGAEIVNSIHRVLKFPASVIIQALPDTQGDLYIVQVRFVVGSNLAPFPDYNAQHLANYRRCTPNQKLLY